MNTYYVKTEEQYSGKVEIEADRYEVGNKTLDFWADNELVASFWNGDWTYVERVVVIDE